jgi:hypothetical protein
MKIKLIANKESYGFLGKLWAKGDVVEVEKGTKYPEDHFDLITPPEIKKPKKEEK